jgi:antitoxin MazE
MEAKVVRIGNSQGVRIPKAALQQVRLAAGQSVRLEVVQDTIVISPERNVRQGWKEAFARAGAQESEDLWQGVPQDEAWDK